MLEIQKKKSLTCLALRIILFIEVIAGKARVVASLNCEVALQMTKEGES